MKRKPIKSAKPTKKSLIQFAFYNLGGVAFFIIGYLVFAVLYGIFSWRWWIAKIVADIIGWLTNYVIQRYLAFREESKHHKDSQLFARFSIISLLNVPIDYAIVGGLKFVGVSPFIGLWISSIFFTVWKFVWYKVWVFAAPKK